MPAPAHCYDVVQVTRQRYTARIGHGASIAEGVPYDELVPLVLEFLLRAAIAKATDQSSWEQEEVRRGGLRRIEFACEGKALWWDRNSFAAERREAERDGLQQRFDLGNADGTIFFETLDADLRERLRRAGYATPSLLANMKELFLQIDVETADRAAAAREALVAEILADNPEPSQEVP